MLALMLNPHYKGLGFIQYVDKERAQWIATEYDHQILFPFLVCAYKIFNPNDVGAQALNFIPQRLKPQLCMTFWKQKNKWHRQWWKNNRIISRSKVIK
jgi:hypothetical protein